MLRLLGLIALSCLSIRMLGQDPIFYLDFNEEGGTAIEATSGMAIPINNAFDRPERIPGNFGTALRLDGYSTYLDETEFYIQDYSNQLTVELWYTTEAFTKEPAALIQSLSEDGGFSLQINSFGNLMLSFFFNGQKRVLTPNKRLSTYSWHHIVASIDGIEGKARIYVDGDKWMDHSFTANSVINNTASGLWIGKSSLNQNFAGFSLNTLNGAIDELKVYNVALSEADVLANLEQANTMVADLAIDPDIRFEDDYLRPRYHPMPNSAWTNEAYGLTYYNGKYHLFFQKNPNGPYLYFMHWGHLSSTDLVNWKEEQVALAPSPGFDDFGVWSGAIATDQNGEPVLFYTGVDGAKAGIGRALPLDEDLLNWDKDRDNPLIPNPPPAYFSMDFRDPYIFQDYGLYYMIVGSGIANNGGGILFSYTSTDLKSWTLVNPIFQSTDYNQNGTFWEMPALFPVTEEDYVLAVTPQFAGAPADVLYWVGQFDGTSFQPYDEKPTRLESLSRNLLAPAFGKDEADQWTYLGIIPDDRDVGLQIAAGWRHTFSLPRLVRLLDDKKTLASIPHPNLCRLRQDTMLIGPRNIVTNSSGNLPEFSGNQCEMQFDLNFSNADQIQLQLLKSQNGAEKTNIILDKVNGRIGLDRRTSSPYPTVEDLRFNSYTFNPSGDVSVRVFLDHSVLEVFIDQLVVFSARVYPSETSQLVDIKASGGDAFLKTFRGFHLADKTESFEQISCMEEDLPNALFTSVINLEDGQKIRLFPNPTHDWLQIDSPLEQEIKVFDLQGRCLINAPTTYQRINLSDLAAGIYIIRLKNDYGIYSTRVVKQ